MGFEAQEMDIESVAQAGQLLIKSIGQPVARIVFMVILENGVPGFVGLCYDEGCTVDGILPPIPHNMDADLMAEFLVAGAMTMRLNLSNDGGNGHG